MNECVCDICYVTLEMPYDDDKKERKRQTIVSSSSMRKKEEKEIYIAISWWVRRTDSETF